MNRKMKLELDALAVESFSTGDAEGARGTVHGHATGLCSNYCNTIDRTCDGGATCGEYTCAPVQHSCAPSCGACDTYYCGGDGDSLVCGGGGSGITGCETCSVEC